VISEQEVTEAQDTEITLGTGKLVGIFVALVVLCAVFFAFGFSMGRNSVKAGLTLTETPDADPPSPAVSKTAPTTILRPSPLATEQKDAPATDDKTVEKSDAPAATPVAQVTPASETTHAETAAAGYVVQIAAVSKQEDADALVGALKKKNYPVFVADATTDKLFHVQIGPFADIKDAEAMRARLTADGYNPILKR